MNLTREELEALLLKAERYLRQEQYLFGDTLFASSNDMTPSKPVRKIEKPAAEEVDLFGQVVAHTPKGKHEAIPAVTETAYPNEPWVRAESLGELDSLICNCTKCALGHTRTNFVFGVGSPHAEVVLIGEAPGAEEDLQGEPFVGRAGQLLNKILEAIHFKREEVYICNILKCRPPNNRDPQPEEIDACEPHLWKQLELIKPKLILCLGRISAQVLLRTNDPLAKLRGQVHDYRGIKLMVTYHPAALLRNPGWKRPAWEDLQKFRKMYDELKSQS